MPSPFSVLKEVVEERVAAEPLARLAGIPDGYFVFRGGVQGDDGAVGAKIPPAPAADLGDGVGAYLQAGDGDGTLPDDGHPGGVAVGAGDVKEEGLVLVDFVPALLGDGQVGDVVLELGVIGSCIMPTIWPFLRTRNIQSSVVYQPTNLKPGAAVGVDPFASPVMTLRDSL